ncbi:homocysteine S-methyltransferase family protein [Sabulicella glaciei]|uniref:Homocysteine S-methyltransferase family protein n=1 Tax=Sabulicella glaciei TaxID=2984948 RepID=A0ABT3P1K7_9PROT|nr:homocysteine S-methyltransferase family protein [Roseococcus sp. MDT2-1-1]MCW8088073.1 homocysteine S-methyltransferase family protein [Roseococcus sp. MDT2-1-1]
MAKYRAALPQLTGANFLTDGGMETTLIFHQGVDLPCFASFVLLETEEGREQLRAYHRPYLELARRRGLGFVLDTATWRANPDWGAKLGYDAAGLDRINRLAVAEMLALREEYETPGAPHVVSGAIGPRGDGYKQGRMDRDEAEEYHAAQIASFAAAGADMVAGFTLTGIEEAIGIARAARRLAMPCAISFTLETDGRLLGGETLREAIEAVDAATGGSPAYFMLNCVHPEHLATSFEEGGDWTSRILGLRANASTKSHAELDESETLDEGNPLDLGRRYVGLRKRLPALRILGGCCGTDHRHVTAICEAAVPVTA